jgi:hypothetical protein
VQAWDNVASTWLMPFMFLISGASLFYALQKSTIKWSTVGTFIKDKVLRLLVPLVVGVFSYGALQVYLERITHGQYTGSFFQWIPNYFDGIYGFGGNFALVGMHMWYVAVLFMLSMICLPVLLLLKSKPGAYLLDKVMKFFSLPGFVYLFMLVNLGLWELIDPDSFLGFDKFGNNLGIYLSYLLCGYMIFSSQAIQQSIQKVRWISLVGCIIFTVIQIVSGEQDELEGWFTILTFLGFGLKYLNFNKPILKYANEAVLPFYILHQTVIVTLGFFVVQWAIPDLLKFLFILSVSFLIVMVLYEYLVRRLNLLRFLFGMKLLPKSPAAQPQLEPSHP